jgi:hypothetical protein
MVISGKLFGTLKCCRSKKSLWVENFHPLALLSASISLHCVEGVLGLFQTNAIETTVELVGEEAILFLHQFSPGQYFVMGGPSGRFEVRKGLVQPVNNEGVKLPSSLTEQQFYIMLQTA